MKSLCLLLILFADLLFSSTVTNTQEGFDNPFYGWASETPGGRNGQLIRVTNLNSDGPGSLSAAVAAHGPRIIVFEVGGNIDLKSNVINVQKPFLTIAGQTAPSPGITIINGGISISTHDIIIQHIRVRPGASRRTNGDIDAIGTNGAFNVVIDHCTLSWGVDENCSVSGPRFNGNSPDQWRKNTSHRITISNNIISEGLSNSIHSKGEHSKGTLVHDNASDILFYHNLYASNMDRNVLFKGGASSIFANNYIYNPGRKAIEYALVKGQWQGHKFETGKLTIIGNILQYGPDSKDLPLLNVQSTGPCQVYMKDNIATNIKGEDVLLINKENSAMVKAKPIWYSGLRILKVSELKASIVENAGARPWDRDKTDKRIINEMQHLKGKIIDSESEVGGYPILPATKAVFKESEWDLKNLTKKDKAAGFY